MDISNMGRFSDVATFGFELEFLVLCKEARGSSLAEFAQNKAQVSQPPQMPEEPQGLTTDTEDLHEIHMRRVHHFGGDIAKKLTEAGISTAYRKKGHPEDGEISNADGAVPKLGEFGEFCYSCYKENTIVPEETMIWTDPAAFGKRMAVRPSTPEGHFWLGFEFVSKVYRYRDFESAKLDLDTICSALREHYIASINVGRDSAFGSSRCATHIHWGLSGRPYELLTVKRVLTLMWVVEEMLMDLHATWRRDAKKYAALLQKGTNMATDNFSELPCWIKDPGRDDMWDREMEQNVPPRIHTSLHRGRPKVQWLWRAESVNDLAMLVGEASRSRRASVAVTELLSAASGFTGKVRRSQLNTVEFRHMQGSLHPALIAAWIDVTARIMCRCVDSSPQEFRGFLEGVTTCVSRHDSTVHSLLDKLDVSPYTCGVFRRLDQQRLGQEADPKIPTFLPVL
ncbi:hypothetical protein GGR54DRAFT_162438 [Hypoxylon sp. NC1633]|nr:hypothetical protein GGR54DRAFT_162438 [Hypoxylon sp. NC1633]